MELHDNALCPTRMSVHAPGAEPQVVTTRIEGAGYVPQLREVQMRVRAGEIESPVMPHADTLSTNRTLTNALSELGVIYP